MTSAGKSCRYCKWCWIFEPGLFKCVCFDSPMFGLIVNPGRSCNCFNERRENYHAKRRNGNQGGKSEVV